MAINSVDSSVAVELDGKQYRWQPYEFSWRWGLENDAGHQGYHGLKAEMPRDFVALGRMEMKPTTTLYTAEPEGSLYYLWTSAAAPRHMMTRIVMGGDLPAAVWLRHAPLAAGTGEVVLDGGGNPVLLRYEKPGRGHFLLVDSQSPAEWVQSYPLAGPWYQRPGVIPFDTRPSVKHPTGWYRTTAPPGMRGMRLTVRGEAEVRVDGRWARAGQARVRPDGAREYQLRLSKPIAAPAKVELRIRQERGSYAGAALVEPIAFDCAPGLLETGDWSQIEGLSSYSGGAWYRREVTLSPAQAKGRIWLDLGDVSASAELTVNGRRAGVKLAPPFRWEVTGLMTAGRNQLEVLVYSALSNHYQTIPTRYRKPGPSGLLGPVRLLVE